jgi:hypothetical protein
MKKTFSIPLNDSVIARNGDNAKYRMDFPKRTRASILTAMGLALSQKFPQTVVLESEKPRVKAFRFQFLMLVAAVVLGSLIDLFGPAWARTILDQVKLDNTAAAAAMFGALLVSVVVHETGHLLAALSLNFHLLGFALGPLRYERQPGASSFWFSSEGWFRCSVSAVPRETQSCWNYRMMTVIAAGQAATLLLLMISSVESLAGHTVFWSASAEINLLLFVLGLVPNGRLAKTRNDAELFLAVWRNGADAFEMRMCHQALELGLGRLRPRDYPERLMSNLAGLSGRPYTNLIVAKRMVEWALDNNDQAMASAWDEHALTACLGLGRRTLNQALAESGCIDLLFRDQRSSALTKFAQVDFARLRPPFLAERAKAAWLIARDLPHMARVHILCAQQRLPPEVPYCEYERAILAQLHTKAI